MFWIIVAAVVAAVLAAGWWADRRSGPRRTPIDPRSDPDVQKARAQHQLNDLQADKGPGGFGGPGSPYGGP